MCAKDILKAFAAKVYRTHAPMCCQMNGYQNNIPSTNAPRLDLQGGGMRGYEGWGYEGVRGVQVVQGGTRGEGIRGYEGYEGWV